MPSLPVPFHPRSLVRSPSETLARHARGPILFGVGLGAAFLGGFMAWALLVPLAGGAVAPAVISPDGSRRSVQHLEGGIIAELKVRDGDVVQAGQALLVLDNLQPAAVHEALLHQHRSLIATRARLAAEQEGASRIAFPPELERDDAPALRTLLAGQVQLFETRRSNHLSRRSVLHQRIEQSIEQIAALNAQVESTARQLRLIGEELEGKEKLRAKEIIPKPEILRIQRMQAEIEGKRGEYLGTIARIRQQIGETKTQLLSLDAERADQIATQMDKVGLELATVTERLLASRDVLERTVIAAPLAGTVVNLRFKSRGGVVGRGEPILDVVPLEEKLLIDARVAPTDIDVVRVGLPAQVHLSAFANRGLPRIEGVVRTVSADRITDSVTNQSYFLVRVEVDRIELKRLDPAIELVPGMPAEVLIVAGERTLGQYLLEPISQAFRRSLREI
jgi:HlyD family secretion protein